MKTYVVVYEQFFTSDEGVPHSAISDALETLREQGGARIVRSYSFKGGPHDSENREWLGKAIDMLTLPIVVEP